MSMIIELPNAIRQASGEWTKEVELSEMTGEEEDILADSTRESGGKGTLRRTGPQRITDILSRCTVRVGVDRRPEGKTRFNQPNFFAPHWDNAFSNDRLFAMIRLRQLTLGSTYKFDTTCEECRKELKNVVVELAELEVTNKPLEVCAHATRDVKLPKSGEIVSWRMITGSKDEDWIAEARKTMKSEYISALMFRRIARVNGESPPNGLEYMKRMHSADRRFLANYIDAEEGGIDSSMQIRCDECRTEFTQKIEILGGDFFFPSEV